MKKLLALLALLAMVVAACGADAEQTDSTEASDGETLQSDGEQLSVVVTTTIWGDVVSNVTGDSAAVEVLFPIGADPHDYQLSAAQAASMQQADLVVVNGLALEEGILDVIEGLEADGANVVEVAALLDPLAFGKGSHAHEDEHSDDEHSDEEGEDSEDEHSDEEGEHSEEDHGAEGECDPEAGHGDHDEQDGDHGDEEADEHGHAEGSCDPHVWMDPLRVAAAAELIAEELAALDPSVDWMANATAYADELRALDAEVVSMLDAVREDRRKMVTNHEAFGYFAERYDFELVGVVVPGGSTLADPSSAELAELVDVMTDENIDVIFAETTEPAALAEAVAAEVGDVDVVELFTGSLGGPGSGAETYVDFVRTNAERVAGALS